MYLPDSTTARAAQHRADLLRDAEHSRQAHVARRAGTPRRTKHAPVLRAAVDRLRRKVTAPAPTQPVTG